MTSSPPPPSQNIPGINTPLVYANSLVATRAWYLFLVSLFRGIGIPLPFSFYADGQPSASLFDGTLIVDPCFFPPDFIGSQIAVLVQPMNQNVISINRIRNGVSTIAGSITVPPVGDPIFMTTGNSQQNFLSGDILQVAYSFPINAFITLRATRN